MKFRGTLLRPKSRNHADYHSGNTLEGEHQLPAPRPVSAPESSEINEPKSMRTPANPFANGGQRDCEPRVSEFMMLLLLRLPTWMKPNTARDNKIV